MKPTAHNAKLAVASKTGRFALPCGPHRVKGTGAPEAGRARGLILATLAALCAVVCGSAFAAAPAFAATHRGFTAQLGEPGSGAGQMEDPKGVAVNDTTGDVYVADEGNNRIDEFKSDGAFVRAWGLGVADGITENFQICELTCFKGIAGEIGEPAGGEEQFSLQGGEEQFSSPAGIAVDNSGKSPSEDPSVGDVYVINDVRENSFQNYPVIYKFGPEGKYLGLIAGTCEKAGETPPSCHGFVPFEPAAPLLGVAVDPTGEVWVDGLIDSGAFNVLYSFSDALVNEFSSLNQSQITHEEPFQLGLAAGSSDTLYAIYRQTLTNTGKDTPIVAQLAGNGSLLDRMVGGEPASAVAVDPSNDVYVNAGSVVEVFNGLLEHVETFGELHPVEGEGMAVGSASGPVYVSNRSEGAVDVFTLGEAPKEAPKTTEPPGEIGPTSAKLQGELNPGGATGKLEYQFDYNTDGSCTGAQRVPVPAGEVANASKAAVSVKATDLQPNTKYTYCLVAFNPFGSLQGNQVSFATPKLAPEVLSESTMAPVKATVATLQAQINPNNQETIPTFEYSTSEAEMLAGHGTKLAGVALNGYSATGVAASVETGSVLTQNTTYYYRVLAKNASGEEAIGNVEHFTTAIPPETLAGLEANPVGGATATLKGVLNPNHKGNPGTYEFFYQQSPSECDGAGHHTVSGAATGVTPEPVSAELTGLEPLMPYTFCLRVSNVAGESVTSAPVMFMTLSEGPETEEEWVTQVSATAATLQAKIDPRGAQTTYRFEYLTLAQFESDGNTFGAGAESTPESPPIGSDDTGHLAGAYIEGLRAHTTYHYRVLAFNVQSPPGGSPGPDQTFTTWPSGSGFALPDNRQWELVSPPPGIDGSTAAADELENDGGPLIQAAEDGGAITYGVLGSVEATPPGFANWSQVLSVREPGGGWSSREIATAREHASGVAVGVGQEYRFFSGNLSLGLVDPSVAEGLGSGDGGLLSPAASEATLFLRADEPLSPSPLQQGPFSEALAEGGYKALVTSKPGYANVPAGTKVQESLGFDGASPDLSHVVLSSAVPLTATTPTGKTTKGKGLYEWSAGRLQLVSLLPNHRQAAQPQLGTADNQTRGAVSSDGSRVVWSNGQGNEAHLYMRDLPLEQTIQLDKNQGGSGRGEPHPEFQFASSDGSKVFFTDSEDLTADATAGEANDNPAPDLYECEMVEEAGELQCELKDLTVDPGGHAAVQGAVEVGGDDSSYVYFVANGVLTEVPNGAGEKAVPGDCAGFASPSGATCNLYVRHYDEQTKQWESPVFIAALSREDERDWGHGGNLEITSRVSPDGRYLAFMSDRELTGYDNHDAYSGVPDEEVYEYDAGTNRLVCASCNPTGERPVGLRVSSPEAAAPEGRLMDGQELWIGRWVAANVPGWSALDTSGNALSQSAYLSDEGRLFFNSPDHLVSQATNGLADVYEYEPAGVGGCGASSVTFGERSGGCVGLISSGSSGEEAAFVGASENGDDVFFESSTQLTSVATSGSTLEVYDAHACSALAPCLAQVSPPPPCNTEATCKAAPTPQPAIFGSGPSETFSGAGNVAGGAPNQPAVVKAKTKTVKCAKGKHLSHNKCKRDGSRRGEKKKAKAKKSVHTNRGAGR